MRSKKSRIRNLVDIAVRKTMTWKCDNSRLPFLACPGQADSARRTAGTSRKFRASGQRAAGALAAILFLMAGTDAACTRSAGRPDSSTKWVKDGQVIVDAILKKHPMPFRRISAPGFFAQVARFNEEAAQLNDDEAAVRLMQLVASLRDGHTALFPAQDVRWFPVRFYELSDGVYITAIARDHKDAAGAKLLRIGRAGADEAVKLARSAYSSDNDFGAKAAVSLFSSPAVLHGLHIIESPDSVPLTLRLRDGSTREISLAAVEGKPGWDWIQWGEMYGPSGTDLVTAFPNVPAPVSTDPATNRALPLHLRARRAFWFTWLEAQRSVYAQINAMANRTKATGQSFQDFVSDLFKCVDSHAVDRLVLDIRYNSGGNGRLVNSLLHQLIKRDAINAQGHLFTITGGKTFSAAVGLLVALKQHTETILVGEPAGAAMNSSGDPDELVLPESKMSLIVSTNFYTGNHFKDLSWEIPVDLPALMSSEDYFDGRDPAVESAFSMDAGRTMLSVIEKDGAAEARKLYAALKGRYGSIPWWQPFTQVEMNEAGYSLLERKRGDDAVAAFAFNTDRFPGSWEAWDSLAEGLMGVERYAEAIAAYEKALSLEPDNWNAGAEKKAIEKMRAAAKK